MKKIYYILILLVIILVIAILYVTQNNTNEYDNYTVEEPNNISNNLIHDYDETQDHEEYEIVGYDDMGYPIYVSYYYTSGN